MSKAQPVSSHSMRDLAPHLLLLLWMCLITRRLPCAEDHTSASLQGDNRGGYSVAKKLGFCHDQRWCGYTRKEKKKKNSPLNIFMTEFSLTLVVEFSVNSFLFAWLQFSAVAQSCPTLCNPMDCSTQGFPVHHQLPEPTQTHVHWVGDLIQPSHPLSSLSPPAFNLSQHQGLFQWISSSHQVAKVLEFQLQH